LFKNFSYVSKATILFALYFITAKFGLTLDAVGGFATLVWLPTGISLAALILLGFKFWPVIALGAFLTNLSTGASPLVAIGISLGNTFEAVIGAYLLKRLIGFRNSLDRLKDVIGLILLAAIVSTSISATIGVSSLWFGKIITLSNYPSTWVAWWVGDMVSDLVVAPFILVWSSKSAFRISSRKSAEALGLLLLVGTVNLIIFRDFLHLNPLGSPIAYIVFPPLILAALRFGQRGAITTNLIFSIMAVGATARGFGPFVEKSLSQSLLSLQFFMGVTSVTGLILGAIAAEREQIEERKDEFISMASHELKTPITTIKGYTQILNQFLKQSKQSHDKNLLSYIYKMEQQLNRLTKLVNDLLDVSKIQSGKLQLQRQRFKVDKLVEEVIEDMQIISKHKIAFEKNGKIPKVWADRYHISEVLVNLISNAIKYSPRSDKIFIRTSSNGEEVTVSVQDFGIGISKQDKDRVFERFFQADTRIRQSFQGLGLGLYISAEIIRQHGGSMLLDSVKGSGSTFAFRLPTRRTN